MKTWECAIYVLAGYVFSSIGCWGCAKYLQKEAPCAKLVFSEPVSAETLNGNIRTNTVWYVRPGNTLFINVLK